MSRKEDVEDVLYFMVFVGIAVALWLLYLASEALRPR